MNARAPKLRLVAIVILSIWLASCATSPPAPVEAPITLEEQALQAEQRGEYKRAADLWQQAASENTGAAEQALLLKAAEASFKAGNRARATLVLDGLSETRLPPRDQQRYRLLRAELALSEGDMPTALRLVSGEDQWLSPEHQRRAENIISQIARFQGGTENELLERISTDLQPKRFFNLTEASALLARYETVPSASLLEASMLASLEPRAASWAALMVRIRQGILDGNRLGSYADEWKRDYPTHEVGREEFLEMAYLYSQRFAGPANIAVLLPMEGGLSAAGTAIRDGLLSAYLENPGTSQLRFYTSGDTPAEAMAAYRLAVENGADWVIGPVRQESVQAIAELDPRVAPTLALNDPVNPDASTVRDGFFSLSLSQETEAATIADKMLGAGVKRAITLTNDSAWGTRMETAFADAFSAGGGEVVDFARFATAASDHSLELTRVLQIDQSRDRKDRLQALLGTGLGFEPHLRDDFDAFFLSSIPAQARQIRPQLRFYEAGDTPLFAVSRVYSGIPDPTADRDLNGTILPLSALQLATATASAPSVASVREGTMLNLYALGKDSWDVLKWLPLLQADPDLRFPGATGRLDLQTGGRLHREPAWAIFVGGRPAAYEPAAMADE